MWTFLVKHILKFCLTALFLVEPRINKVILIWNYSNRIRWKSLKRMSWNSITYLMFFPEITGHNIVKRNGQIHNTGLFSWELTWNFKFLMSWRTGRARGIIEVGEHKRDFTETYNGLIWIEQLKDIKKLWSPSDKLRANILFDYIMVSVLIFCSNVQ